MPEPALPPSGAAVARPAALRSGWTDAQLRMACRRGQLYRPLRGAYVDAGLSAPEAFYRHPYADQLLRTACGLAARLPPDGALSDDTAAFLLFGLWPRDMLPHAVVPPWRVPGRCAGAAVRSAPLSSWERTVACGLPVTSPARTAIDLARHGPRRHGLAALDAALHAGVAKDDLRLALERYAGGRGVVQARALLSLADGGAGSPGESVIRLLVLDAGLGPVRTQAAIFGSPYLVDLVIQERLFAEFEGGHHDAAAQRDYDAARYNALASVRYAGLVRFRWHHTRTPGLVERMVRAGLSALAGQPLPNLPQLAEQPPSPGDHAVPVTTRR